ncbi:YxeA family protein [Alkalibacterium sp. s-m-22]
MKNSKLLLSVLIVLSLLIGFLAFRDTVDRFNPFIEYEYVYATVNDEPEEVNGRYKYTLDGYNEDGNLQRIVFTSSLPLDQGTPLRVMAKGTHTDYYEILYEE